jgi:hypothetical protein
VCRVEIQPLPHWDFAVAYREARQRVATGAGMTVSELDQAERDIEGHVGRARRRAEIMAPALMRLQMALLLGTSPEELDRVRGGARLMLEGIKTSLAMVGLRAGEEVALDLSDRMQGFLTKWQERRELGEPVVIEQDANEPLRRVLPQRDSKAVKDDATGSG